jgi:hypothetical protein
MSRDPEIREGDVCLNYPVWPTLDDSRLTKIDVPADQLEGMGFNANYETSIAIKFA